MDDHPLLDMGKGESFIPPPRVAMYLGDAMRDMWMGPSRTCAGVSQIAHR